GATGADGRMVASSPPTGDARLAVLAPGGSGGTDPATDVLSTFWEAGRHDAYEARGGTSASAAYVSGALALLLAEGYNSLGAVERGPGRGGGLHAGRRLGAPGQVVGLVDVGQDDAHHVGLGLGRVVVRVDRQHLTGPHGAQPVPRAGRHLLDAALVGGVGAVARVRGAEVLGGRLVGQVHLDAAAGAVAPGQDDPLGDRPR